MARHSQTVAELWSGVFGTFIFPRTLKDHKSRVPVKTLQNQFTSWSFDMSVVYKSIANPANMAKEQFLQVHKLGGGGNND